MKKTALLLLVALVLGWTGCSSDSTVEVKNLRLEMKENPLGINVVQPRFSWQIASGKPDLKQTAYQIQVAASPEQLESGDGLLWDSGVVRSDESVLVPYAGKALESGKPYYWRVKLTTNRGILLGVMPADGRWRCSMVRNGKRLGLVKIPFPIRERR